jgi:hypothetical protein
VGGELTTARKGSQAFNPTLSDANTRHFIHLAFHFIFVSDARGTVGCLNGERFGAAIEEEGELM